MSSLDLTELIKARDCHSCILCGSKRNLHVHHIETRGSGGSDDRYNLVTLCFSCHRDCAHGTELAYYKAVFEKYVLNFPRPENWDDMMEMQRANSMAFKMHQRKKQKELREKQKKFIKKPEKSAYQRQKEYYQEKYGMSMRKYKYKQSKGLQ